MNFFSSSSLIRLASFFVLNLVCSLVVQAQNEKVVGALRSLYFEEFSIRYPETWRVDTSGQLGTKLFLFSPLEVPADSFYENVNLIIQDLKTDDFTLEDYENLSKAQLEQFMGGQILGSAIEKFSGGERLRMEFKHAQGELPLRALAFCTIRNKKAYLLTYSAEAGKYTTFLPFALEIVESFKFN